MSTLLPVPTLDHVVVNLHDNLDAGQARYERLGFTLTPRGYHTLGSTNHLAMFGTHYLELLGASPQRRPEIMDHPMGLNGLVFGTESCAAVHEALSAAGVSVGAVQQFSRPVALADGAQDASFRTVHLASTPLGRVYFCEHLTRGLVWRDEWRRHPNGAIGISRFVIAAHEPARLAAQFARMFGPEAVRVLPEGARRLQAEHVGIDVLSPRALTEEFSHLFVADDHRDEHMAALFLRVHAIEQTIAALGDIPHERRADGSVLVAPAQTMGVILVFHE